MLLLALAVPSRLLLARAMVLAVPSPLLRAVALLVAVTCSSPVVVLRLALVAMLWSARRKDLAVAAVLLSLVVVILLLLNLARLRLQQVRQARALLVTLLSQLAAVLGATAGLPPFKQAAHLLMVQLVAMSLSLLALVVPEVELFVLPAVLATLVTAVRFCWPVVRALLAVAVR